MLSLEKSRVEAFVGETVLDFSVSAGCTTKDGMNGSLKSVSVTTTSGKELHLILKEIDMISPWAGGERSVEVGSFKIENMVYSALIPKLTEFAKSRGVNAHIPVPHIYDCYKGGNPVDDYICMEDVRFQGYKMTDKYAGLTLEETLLVMKEIGRFHALTFALIKYEGEKIFAAPPFSTLVEFYSPNSLNGTTMNSLFVTYSLLFQNAINNGIELMEKRNPSLHQKMKTPFEKTGAAEKFPELQFGIVFGTDLKYFPVISHGDLWSNNILFKYNTEGIPISIKFLDFQLSRRGNIYEDLTYFLYTSTTPEFRRNHPLSPLKTYFDSFTGMLKELKIPQPIGFTFGTFLNSFNENIPYVYRYMMFAIPLQLGTPLPEVAGIMQEKGKGDDEASVPPTQISEKEGMQRMFTAMLKIQMETNEKAMDRLESITQEMADLNLI